jgi:putative transposase
VAGIRLLGFCLMPNHWHLVLWPEADGELSLFMSWLSNTHVRRYHQHYHSYGQGHIYQGRFKSFPIEEDEHLLTVLRYVEANPLRAKMVERAGEWRWSSMSCRRSPRKNAELLSEWPVDRPADWTAIVNETMPRPTLSAVRGSVKRNSPFGDPDWTAEIAQRLGLQSTLNPRGRPSKK